MSEKIPAPTPKEDLNVLIIDNQGLVHDIVKSALSNLDMRKVSSAVNAYHALRLCEAQTFDIVLIAFNVSNDKDGFHLFEELKHLNHITDKTTVVFLSAETSQALVNCIVELQPDDFWVKPLDRTRVETRLNYLVGIRSKLNKMLYSMQQRDFSTAMYYAERHLADKSVSEFHPRLKRLVGDCYIQLRDYVSAEKYFHNLLQTMDHAWVHIGLARSLLKQDRTEEAETLIEDLLERSDTRFLALDLMAQHYIEKEQFDRAYEQVKLASQLAPRNIERNKKLWDLARLNHDKMGQLTAVQNMAKFAKNSIHDSPDLQLNVIRSTIDYATSVGGEDAVKLFRKAQNDIEELKQRKGAEKALGEQISVITARLLCLKNDKKGAEKIMKDKKPLIDGQSMEDNLDKMKAFHELGMKEQSLSILDQLRKQIAGDTFSSQVVDEYLKQESIERKEINFTTKELKAMAAVNYKENRLLPAYNNLAQAFTLSPQNKQIALSLLKVLVPLNKKEPLSQEQIASAQRAARLLMSGPMSPVQIEKRDEYLNELKLNTEAENDDVAEQATNG